VTKADETSVIRERGAVGAALLTIRAAAAQVIALLGTLVLTHQLSPTAFGTVAFGTTVIMIGNFLADAGLGAALIRKPVDPTADELRTLLGLQLLLAFAILLGVALVGLQAGTTGVVTALMACSIPFVALRAPHAIALERVLEYRTIASIELTESLAYYLWAVATVWAGWGVWGLASATVVRALAGSVLMTMASPLGLIPPSLTRGTLRSMLGFGLGFQGVTLAALLRTQGVNLVVVAVGGETMLGYWSLANRLMQVPFWLFQALWRVSYPTMARLGAQGEDTRLTVERFARVTALVTGAALAPLAASADYLVPAIFGTNWAPAAAPLPWACAGLVVSGPISVAAAGYLYSQGTVRAPLVATIVNGALWIVLTAGLVGTVGVAAVGIAWMLASWTEAVVFARALRRHANLAVERMIAVPIGAAFASAILSRLLVRGQTDDIVVGITIATLAAAAYLALNLAFNRSDLLAVARRLRSLR
jgi:O-antigen/teichoic acid export membrane protein